MFKRDIDFKGCNCFTKKNKTRLLTIKILNL